MSIAADATTTRRRGGRPPFVPTDERREIVMRLKLAGFVNDDIAATLGVSEKTLAKHFSRELRHARCELLANVAQALYLKAMAGDTTAMIFMLKTQGGWRETRRVEVAPALMVLPAGLALVARSPVAAGEEGCRTSAAR